MPMQRDRYPADWETISQRIRERSGNHCEWCGVANGTIGARDRFGEWHDEQSIHCMQSDAGYDLFGDFSRMIRIVLTVAHYPDRDPMNNQDGNLIALCQKCHLGADRPDNLKKAAETRRRKRLEKTGQLTLFE